MPAGATREDVWAYEADIARLARQLCRHPQDAEDVSQSALLKAVEHVESFRGEASVRTWLHRIAENECRMLRRRRAPSSLDDLIERSPSFLQGLASPGASPEQLVEEHALSHAVLRSVHQLPARQQAAFLLVEGEGLEVAEAAERMGTSISAVRALLVRARRALRAAAVTTATVDH